MKNSMQIHACRFNFDFWQLAHPIVTITITSHHIAINLQCHFFTFIYIHFKNILEFFAMRFLPFPLPNSSPFNRRKSAQNKNLQKTHLKSENFTKIHQNKTLLCGKQNEIGGVQPVSYSVLSWRHTKIILLLKKLCK